MALPHELPARGPLTARALQFRFRGGRLCLDFVATAGGRIGYGILERLHQPEHLALWYQAAGLYPAPPQLQDQDLREALEVRGAIYTLATAHPDRLLPRAAVRRINQAAQASSSPVQLSPNRTHAHPAPADAGAAALAVIAADAVTLFGSDLAQHIRACDGKDCTLLFLDASRPRNRRWCSTRACGNRANAAAARQRKQPREDSRDRVQVVQ